MNTKELYFSKTINSWDEALPLGNGDLGCLIWNNSRQLRISLDKGGIWDCSNPPEEQNNFTYADLKDLISRGKKRKILKKYDHCYKQATPTKLPAGKIILDLGVDEDIESTLNFLTAEARLKIGKTNLKSFISANHSFGMVEIGKLGVKLTVDNPRYGGPKKPLIKPIRVSTVQTLKNLHYPNAEFENVNENDIDYQYFIQPTTDSFYGIIVGKKEIDNKTIIAYTVCVSKQNDFLASGKEVVKNAIENGYDKAFAEHKSWWDNYWSKSSLSIPDAFLEKNWYFNTYLLGAGSRKGHFPMPLQGVWTADNGSLPPWKGDYHHDLNTQMTYTSYLVSNHLENGECFIDYLLNMADAGKRFAKSFYGVEGLCLPAVMDIEGHALGGWQQYSLSPTNQLWLCQIMARYYYFTKNEKYLDKIYNYMQEVGKFLMTILEEKDGYYKLPLSTSPEIHDNRLSAYLTPNSNYDLALMRAFMADMIKLSKEVNNETNIKYWEQNLSKLEPLSVNKDNVLMLSPDESLKVSHRHHSHCMSIFPLRTLKYDTEKNKAIIDSTIKDLESLSIKNWVGYSLGWMAELYIVQGNGDKAFDMLNKFFRYFCTDNGFHSNGDYRGKTSCLQICRLFTLEANFLATDAIQEMLISSDENGIMLFPALPEKWNSAEFSSFLAYGGVEVSAKLENGKIVKLELVGKTNAIIHILDNEKYELPFDLPRDIVIKKGEKLSYCI